MKTIQAVTPSHGEIWERDNRQYVVKNEYMHHVDFDLGRFATQQIDAIHELMCQIEMNASSFYRVKGVVDGFGGWKLVNTSWKNHLNAAIERKIRTLETPIAILRSKMT